MILSSLVTAHERRWQASAPDGTPDYAYRLAFLEGARAALQDVLGQVEALLNPDAVLEDQDDDDEPPTEALTREP